MSTLVAADLDRTLIYSRDAMTLGEPVADPVCVEVYDGRDTSFMTPTALAGLAAVARAATFVPVTTRSTAQLRRVVLPGVRHRYAVATNGARLLVDGVPDRGWERAVGERLAEVASYDAARAALAPVLDRPWVRKRRSAEDVFVYLVLDRDAVEAGWADELAAVADTLGWRTSLQGRKAYVLPAPLTKEAAVAEVQARTEAEQLVAAGDSLLDRGLLEVADVAVRPAHGELHDAGWTRPGLVVTERSGGAAADEIVATMAAAVRRTDRGGGLACPDQSRESLREDA